MKQRKNTCEYYESWKPTTHDFCEEKLCGPIREPSNTFSNIAFLIIGIYIIAHCRNKSYAHLRLLGFFSIMIGLMSGFYHATSSFLGEVLDYSAMYLISTFFVCANMARLYGWSGRKLKIWAMGIFASSFILISMLEVPGALIFGLQLTLAFVLEGMLWKRTQVSWSYRPFLWSGTLFLVAWIFWNLDRLKLLCDPSNHVLTGHAVWHFLTAGAIYFIYQFYSQFELRNGKNKF